MRFSCFSRWSNAFLMALVLSSISFWCWWDSLYWTLSNLSICYSFSFNWVWRLFFRDSSCVTCSFSVAMTWEVWLFSYSTSDSCFLSWSFKLWFSSLSIKASWDEVSFFWIFSSRASFRESLCWSSWCISSMDYLWVSISATRAFLTLSWRADIHQLCFLISWISP